MNRVIKFRGKIKNSNEWKYGSLLTYADGECNIITETGHRIDSWNVDPETVGQYTALKDLNGNEIYEGDIAKFDDSPYCAYATPYMGEVVMRQGTWCIKHQTIFGDVYPRLFRDDFANRKTEILGNIYDNPELLKQ